MVKDCSKKKQGLDAVCFECYKTGHKATNCPKKYQTRVEKGERAHSSVTVLLPEATKNSRKHTSLLKGKPIRRKPRLKSLERKKLKHKRITLVSPSRMRRKRNASKTVNHAVTKLGNTKRRDACRSKLFRTMYLESVEDKAAQLKENRTFPTKKHGSQKKQSGKNINLNMTDVKTKEDTMDIKGGSNAVLVKESERSTSGTSQCSLLNQASSVQESSYLEAIGKVIMLSSRMKAIMVAVEMSYGFTLAEDVCVKGQLCINTLALVDDSQVVASEEKLYNLNRDGSSDRNTVYRNKNYGKSVLVAAEGTVYTVPSFSLEETKVIKEGKQPSPINNNICCHCHGTCRNTGSSIILERGVQVGHVELGLLLSLGISEVKIYKKPRVTLLSFGEELENRDSRITNSSDNYGAVLEAMVNECGGVVVERTLVHDESNINELLQGYLENCDMLLLSGIKTDVGSEILEIFGRSDLTSLRIQSNEQIFFGTLTDCKTRRDKIVFRLPGSMYSAIVAFNLFVKPSLEQMMGSIQTLKSFKIELGETFNSGRHVGDYHPSYFQEDHRGIIVAKKTTS